jgi:hypothetical protein
MPTRAGVVTLPVYALLTRGRKRMAIPADDGMTIDMPPEVEEVYLQLLASVARESTKTLARLETYAASSPGAGPSEWSQHFYDATEDLFEAWTALSEFISEQSERHARPSRPDDPPYSSERARDLLAEIHRISDQVEPFNPRIRYGPPASKPLPSIPDAFSSGRGDIPSSLALQGVLAGLRDGQAGAYTWRKGDAGLPIFDYVQSQGTARVLLRPEGDAPASQVLADVLWTQVTKFTDIDADVLLAMMAQAVGPGPSDADGATWITASAILDYRGVQPIKKREGHVIRRAGHRVEDVQEIAACVNRLSSQWVELLAVETREAQGKRKPPKVLRTTYESRLISVDEQITQGEMGRGAHPVAWRYRLGRCITEFLHGPNRQVAPVMRRVLQYDPYRERFEKRLALYFTIHHRIAASYKAPLRRKIGRLFEELRLPVDRRNPNRSRQRFEETMDRLVTDGVLAGWQYTPNSQRSLDKLPARGWVDDWLACSVETPPARSNLLSGE